MECLKALRCFWKDGRNAVHIELHADQTEIYFFKYFTLLKYFWIRFMFVFVQYRKYL